MNNKPVWNVIEEKQFKESVLTIFEMVSGALENTLGPYGSTTIIEKYGEMHITKDGWNVLKNIRFNDTVHNNILQMLINISAQVVIKVGDGSTSSIIAANEIVKQLQETVDFTSIRPKEFLIKLEECVELISDEIRRDAVQVSKGEESTYDEIYHMASISTNGDPVIPEIIRNIYTETQNPTIQFAQAKDNKTTYEIIDGYQIPFLTYLDTIYVNNDNGDCVIKKPLILLFDHRVESDHFATIINKAIDKAVSSNRRLVVVAPNYDKFVLQKISQQIGLEMKATGTSVAVYAKCTLTNNMSYTLYNDFAVMTGADILKESLVEEIAEGNIDSIDDFIGEVDSMIISRDKSTIKGLYNRNDQMYKIIQDDAVSKYRELETKHRNMNLVNSELYDLKQRVSKLRCKMGVIHVGGNSTLEKTSNYDLVDDAVKACESAFNYGYNLGGCLIIPITINKILENDIENKELSVDTRDLLGTLLNAFLGVFKRVLYNKYKDDSKNTEIVDSCVLNRTCYDLIKDEYSDAIINSCHTDIEILKAACSIVALLISSNQYITIQLNE